jgi:hypothetical protein
MVKNKINIYIILSNYNYMNKWVEHIKEWAKKNNTTYGCALTNIKCKEDYYKNKGIDKKATIKETKLEKENDYILGSIKKKKKSTII